QTVLRQSGKTYYYNHSYFGDGREKSIVAFGDAFGNSTSTYDTNRVRSSVNLGQGDGQNRAEVKTFVADNEGHIVFQFHDDGKTLTIPNSVKTGNITAENHKLYSESEIVGSTLPNLKTPPPPKPKKGCASIIMIIIIVVIAVVAAFFVGPLAGVLLEAALGAT